MRLASKSSCSRWGGYSCIFLILVTVILVDLVWHASARAETTSIWFGPDNDTPDLLNLFEQPSLWSQARTRISVMKLGPQQVSDGGGPHKNNLSDMRRVRAFSLLRSWRIKLAIEAPAIKKWDCSGANTLEYTLKLIRNVQKAGGQVDYITMDGPLIDAVRDCGDTMEAAAATTANYMRQLKSRAPGIQIGESEPYPATSPERIEQWFSALAASGAKPSYLHMDANVHLLDVHPQTDVALDVRAYRDYFKGQGVRFGVIFWSGYDPAPTDEAYYRRSMAWVKRVHAAIGAPEDSIFESWVMRSAPRCTDTDPNCNGARLHCIASDAIGCGEKSVPVNLPEADPQIFSHTRLIIDAYKILTAG